MNTYTPNDVLRVAKRQNNAKRTYLLVNPLQAKHMPVSPAQSLAMMTALGTRLSGLYPNCKLIVGFAETATAIGAVVASCFPDDCVYIHTTREAVPGVARWIAFLEEHSHAAEQKLCGDDLPAWLAGTDQVIFVDDEFSTGKTLINMVRQLRETYPALEDKQLVAASVINRVTEENEAKLDRAGIVSECLVKLPDEDYDEAVRSVPTRPAEDLTERELPGASYVEVKSEGRWPNPRKGVRIGQYRRQCLAWAESAAPRLGLGSDGPIRALVLGTEECMYPALILGQVLERRLQGRVFCHATTRSPIGIAQANDYPIREGYKLHSFYDPERETYLYDLARYDAVVVVSDTSADCARPMGELARALADHGCGKLFLATAGRGPGETGTVTRPSAIGRSSDF